MSDQEIKHDACIVLVTCGTQMEAEKIAETIVLEQLAACVNLISSGSPIKSFYIWEGQLQKETEILLIIKTRRPHLSILEKRLHELHSYTVPEFIVLPIESGSQSYLEWLTANTKSDV